MTNPVLSATVLLARMQARARLRHLQLLVHLADLGSLKRTAEVLHLSQPAATQLLADLERLVGCRLFERHSRGVRLLATGQALLPMAQRALEAMSDGCEALSAIHQGSEQVVRLVALTSAISGLLVRALPSFARSHPGVQILVNEGDANRCVGQVVRGEADLALCRDPVRDLPGTRFDALLPDRFVVACGTGHRLVGRSRLSWAALAREPWLLPPVTSAARRAFDVQMGQIGAQPGICPIVTRASPLTWAMLQDNRLLTIAPYGVVRQWVDAGLLALLDLSVAMPLAPMGLLSPARDGGHACIEFTRFLSAFVRDHP